MAHFESIDHYMNTICKYPLLTPAEERELAQQMKNPDPSISNAAREKLICTNLRLVVKIAHEFRDYGINFPDIVAAGNIGLMTAADKFDPNVGAKFSCYASWWIKQFIRKTLIWNGRTIRIPGGSAQKMLNLEKARSRFVIEYSRQPSDEELAEVMHMTVQQVQRLSKDHVETYSFNDYINDESDVTFEQFISTDPEYYNSQTQQQNDRLLDAVDTLSDLDRTIVTYIFGINGCQQLQLPEIAQMVGRTIGWVTERLKSILEKLKMLLTDARFDLE